MTDLERHAVPDEVRRKSWRLRIGGAVANPLELDREDLLGLRTDTHTADFACAEVGDLRWRGVSIGTLPDRADPTVDSGAAVLDAADGDYACAVALERVDNALLATELDDDPLPIDHGEPAQLVPTDADADCWESVKWVAAIDVTTASDARSVDTGKDIALSRLDESGVDG